MLSHSSLPAELWHFHLCPPLLSIPTSQTIGNLPSRRHPSTTIVSCSMSLARSLLSARAARPALILRLCASSISSSSSSARPALWAAPLFVKRSYAVEVPPPSRTPPANDAESLREAFPEPPPPEVRSALEEVESSEGLRRLAENPSAQDVFKRFSAYLESKGEEIVAFYSQRTLCVAV